MASQDKLIVALDAAGLKEAEKLLDKLSPVVSVFKVGKELFTAEGPRVVEMIQSRKCRVFLDLKFHDIPNTVACACGAAAKLGVFMLNVHLLGGREMVERAAETLQKNSKENGAKKPLLLGVTVLTSLSDNDLMEVGIHEKVKDEVKRLALLAKKCGADGVVASGEEIELVRKAAGKSFIIVTPGVRPSWAAKGDQKRIVTPAEAFRRGADFIVVGRPITADRDPRGAAERIVEETKQ